MLAAGVSADPSSVVLSPVPGNGRAVRVTFPAETASAEAAGVATVVITKTHDPPSPSDLVVKPLPGVAAAYNYWGTRQGSP
jgi:hypothetical protein